MGSKRYSGGRVTDSFGTFLTGIGSPGPDTGQDDSDVWFRNPGAIKLLRSFPASKDLSAASGLAAARLPTDEFSLVIRQLEDAGLIVREMRADGEWLRLTSAGDAEAERWRDL